MVKRVIAVASGKGGTGKTTIATNLARVASEQLLHVTYMDCDVEEPNGHIFMKPAIDMLQPVTVPTPVVDETKCTACGKCSEICHFSAITVLGSTILTFPNLCHGCGGCILVCPTGAITEGQREIGITEAGWSKKVRFIHGKLNVGEAKSAPLIHKVKEYILNDGLTIIDSPPGTSCPVIQAVKGADFVLLVTEPTPFGLHDLKIAVEMIRVLDIPFGVVINRADSGDGRILDYCREEKIEILAEIPDDRRIAEAYSKGLLILEAVPLHTEVFTKLFNRLQTQIAGEDIDN